MNQTNNLLTGVAALALLTFTGFTSRADETGTAPSARVSPPANYPPFTLGIEAGTTGVGGSANWRFSHHFGVGSAFDYFSYSYNGNIKGNNYDLKLRLMSEPLTLNVYPWENHSFHISAGLFFNQNHLSGTAVGTAANPINLDGYNYVGTASVDIKPQVVDPYVGIGGNFYFDKGHHVSLGGELGVTYTGDPRVSLSAPGAPSSDVQAEQDQIHSYAKDLQFWPVIKVSLNYSF